MFRLQPTEGLNIDDDIGVYSHYSPVAYGGFAEPLSFLGSGCQGFVLRTDRWA